MLPKLHYQKEQRPLTPLLEYDTLIGFWRKPIQVIHYDNKNRGSTRLSIINKTID
jgi:hypothetical protein